MCLVSRCLSRKNIDHGPKIYLRYEHTTFLNVLMYFWSQKGVTYFTNDICLYLRHQVVLHPITCRVPLVLFLAGQLQQGFNKFLKGRILYFVPVFSLSQKASLIYVYNFCIIDLNTAVFVTYLANDTHFFLFVLAYHDKAWRISQTIYNCSCLF